MPDESKPEILEIEMLKNRFLTAFALAGLIGFAACAAEDENVEFDDATLEEASPPPPPIQPTPVTVDSMTPADTMGADTAITDSVTM